MKNNSTRERIKTVPARADAAPELKSIPASKTQVQDGYLEQESSSAISLRDKYFLEVEKIKTQIGDLDEIRTKLGLSQRKVCQLLLVDPSAWTRWNKTGAPPHIYQALSWLLELKKLNPHAVAPTDFSNRLDVIHTNTLTRLKDLESNITSIERALTLAPSTAPAYTPADAASERDLHVLEQRFIGRIAELEAKIALLSAQKTKSPKSRKRAPNAKAAGKRKTPRKTAVVNKKSSARRSKTPAKSATRHRKNEGAKKILRSKQAISSEKKQLRTRKAAKSKAALKPAAKPVKKQYSRSSTRALFASIRSGKR